MPAREPYGPALQVTRNRAWEAVESQDGKLLYFAKDNGTLASMPVIGGEEALVLKDVHPEHWAVSDRGIYFTDRSGRNLQFFSFATHDVRRRGCR